MGRAAQARTSPRTRLATPASARPAQSQSTETHAPPYTNSSPIRPHVTRTTASATPPHPSTSHTTHTTHATHSDGDTRLHENNSSTPKTTPATAHAPAPTPHAPTTTLQAHSLSTSPTLPTPTPAETAACPFYPHTHTAADAHDERSPPTGDLCPIGVGGAGIAGSVEAHPLGEGTACEFALALDEACFSCEGVGVVLEGLSEGVLDWCCQVGSAAHRVWSVPSSGAKIDANVMPLKWGIIG